MQNEHAKKQQEVGLGDLNWKQTAAHQRGSLCLYFIH